jgi:DNA-binding winged helix-turn-helix (wHTH) protein
MAPGSFRFDRFVLTPSDRRLTADGAPVELNARYLDALALLVAEAGRLVPKERFMAEVWRGVPVTDEALTQCVRTLRRALGDDAARPRFIETVPKHGYRFVAEVERIGAGEAATPAAAARGPSPWRRFFLLGGAGTIGAGAAGVVGGLVYGFAGASQPLGPGMGAASVLLVLLWLTVAAALMGGAGVAFGIAAACFARAPAWRIVGGAGGGLLVGGAVKLLGVDAFNLLLGRSPGDIAGAGEGILLGGSVGLGAWLAGRSGSVSLRRTAALAAAAGAAGGLLVALGGGRLMAGSLDLLARAFPGSRLRLDAIGALFGEDGLGPLAQAATAAMEGALFGAGIVGAMALARRSLGERD